MWWWQISMWQISIWQTSLYLIWWMHITDSWLGVATYYMCLDVYKENTLYLHGDFSNLGDSSTPEALNQFAIWFHSLIAHLCATSILIPQTNHSHPLTALGSCWLLLWGFYNPFFFFYRHILVWKRYPLLITEAESFTIFLNLLLFVMWD